ncbi:ribosome maturation factor [Weissella ceti]|uniref:Ribosome maturation factor RimP n=1 Tax=Weissella ceti TaxID=759620 RepID=A0ABT3E311_9LACO|nr:ribosome maturation factor [Weissella ceti]MCW0952808.1 ribosome maturation factor [Weissella ceti]QVK12506.1 ribosome maturation factor [Weissella ceti]
MSEIINQVRDVLEQPLTDAGFDLWDLVYEPQDGDMVLRVLVDRLEGSISMDDLVLLTELISDQVDSIQPDPFPTAYMMDVSSPGAERPLVRDHDFAWAMEQKVVVKLKMPVDKKDEFEGVLVAMDDETITVMMPVKGKQQKIALDRANIKLAKMALNQDRILEADEDFAWALNKFVHVSTYKKIDGVKDFMGELLAFTDEDLTISMSDETGEDATEVVLPRDVIAKARQTNNF